MNIQDILVARGGGAVRRYHTTPLIGEQTVAAHSWGVAVLIEQLWPESNANLLLAALHHDISECDTGDVPAPFKIALSKETTDPLKAYEKKFDKQHGLVNYQQLCFLDRAKLHIADKLELMLFCREQILLGNSRLLRVFNKGLELVRLIIEQQENAVYASGPSSELAKDMEPVYSLLHWLNSEVNN